MIYLKLLGFVSNKPDFMINLLKLIHGYDIYREYPYQRYIPRVIGWNVNHELFRFLIEKTQPKLIIELGSWYGASAIAMGKVIKELKLETQILCIDTWLGSYEFIGLHEIDHERQLLPTFGYPNAYYQFLSNICYNNLQDIIVPFPQTIKIACQWLSKQSIYADLIYVDGNNDTLDVYYDILYGWELLKNNGVIFGDDYNNPRWLEINLGLNKICSEKNIKPTIIPQFPNHWTIEKHDIEINNDNQHLIFITCTHNHINRISYFKYLIKYNISKLKNYTWIIVEDNNTIDPGLKQILDDSGVNHTYLCYGPTKRGGNAQRNFALEYIHDCNLNGIIYSLDDDNLYEMPLFDELRQIKKISIFPVGGWTRSIDKPERPILDKDHKFIKWDSGWQRKYSTDMAGFAFHSSLLKKNKKPFWSYISHGGGETEFIDTLVSDINDIEFNLCDYCTKCYVYHNKLREIQHPEVDSIEIYRTPECKFNTKYGHSDSSAQTHSIIGNMLSGSFNSDSLKNTLDLIEKVYSDTEGCFGGPDRIELASIIRNVANLKKKSTILELGCWKGRVSVALNLFKNTETNIISVDNFLSEDGLNECSKKCDSVRDIFNKTLSKFNITNYQLIEEHMENIDWSLLNLNPISYIYYDATANDIIGIKTFESLMPFLSNDCIIEFHDSSWPIVTKIVEYLINQYKFIKLYKIDIWEGSLVIQRMHHVLV